MPETRLYLFGAPRLEVQGQPVAIDTRKALALLAYLLIENQPQSRDTLAALLWPESDQSAARAALRRTLSPLRSALSDDIIDFGRELIAIHPGEALWCDVSDFQAQLAECRSHGHAEDQTCPRCLAPLQKAAALYQDDFMAGFSLRDSVSFDDWQFFETDRLRREFASVLERLVAIQETQADFVGATDDARRWLSLDPLNETAHRALISLYAQSDQRNAALRQYRQCVRILDQELGVPPLDETTRLYEAVKENRLEKGVIGDSFSVSREVEIEQQITGHRPLITDLPPLVGRDSEWEMFTRLYGQIGQNGFFAALTGEAGIGKTRLAQDFLAYLAKPGTLTLSTRAYAGETNLAYGPIIDLLRQGIHQKTGQKWWQNLNPRWISEIALLIPEVFGLVPDLPPLQPSDGPGAQSRFYEGICQTLIALVAGSTPGAILLDNLEWADESTLDLLAYFVRRLQGRPVFLLAAWREDGGLAVSRLEQILSDAMQQGYALHLPLETLPPQQAHESD